MKIVQADDIPLQRGLEHRGGTFHSRRLLEGEPGALDNYQLTLGQMGGDEAAAKLAQYLKTPHADNLGAAAGALARIDKHAARNHAKRLLSSDHPKFIHWMDRSTLEKVAKDE